MKNQGRGHLESNIVKIKFAKSTLGPGSPTVDFFDVFCSSRGVFRDFFGESPANYDKLDVNLRHFSAGNGGSRGL